MWRLMRLEWIKFKLRRQIVLSAMLVPLLALIAVFFPLVERMESPENDLLFADYPSAFRWLLLMCGSVFLLQASVLVVSLLLEEYKGKTVSFLYAYPLPRSRLLWAKAALIMVWTFLAVTSSCLLSTFVYVWANEWLQYHGDPVTFRMLAGQCVRSFQTGLFTAGIALIPYFVASRSMSAPVTILSVLFIMTALGAPLNAGWPAAGDAIALALALLGLLLGTIAIRRLSVEDIPNQTGVPSAFSRQS